MSHDDLIQTWRDHLGYTEWQITVALDGYGTDQAAAERMLDAFVSKHPDTGPVVDIDGRSLHVTFALHAGDAEQAGKLAETAFLEAAVASGLDAVSWSVEIRSIEDGVAIHSGTEAVPA